MRLAGKRNNSCGYRQLPIIADPPACRSGRLSHGSLSEAKTCGGHRGVESVTRPVYRANSQVPESCKRFSQPTDMYINCPGFYSVWMEPNAFDKLLAGTDLTLLFE